MCNIKQLAGLLMAALMIISIKANAERHPNSGRPAGHHQQQVRPTDYHRSSRFVGHYHNHPRFGLYFGYPWWPRPYYPYYPYYPYSPYYPYYPPGIVTIPADPPVYIERGTLESPRQPSAGYWYYCTDPTGYYPYVKACPGGWRQVDPIPPK